MIRLVWAKAEIGLKKTFVIFIIFASDASSGSSALNFLQTDMYIFFPDYVYRQYYKITDTDCYMYL
jgi:hypothetical protein